ncbi:Hsp20/alpha crystallin family protein [Sutcliffiella rhizosphaerae]|uniref:Spore coat protein P n=1 Tax=Sutcliffiella rhizosphaerae TaxID=2880967 RepID=A0ABN8A9A5_9BACI|nr:Hsp20/alpha crystallin family protein [Sutcliffiella rhizosphaerae]CAG9621750.1 Spore coat protein P [Sutcliffiella rhizosphaerae]
MNMEKMKKWMELTSQYQNNDFWNKIFTNHSPNQFFNLNDDFPLHDVYQNESHIGVIIELPGIHPDHVQLSLHTPSHLLIKGDSKPLFPSEKEIKKERFYGEFERILLLPEPADANELDVKFHQGLLTIFYPRKNKSVPYRTNT